MVKEDIDRLFNLMEGDHGTDQCDDDCEALHPASIPQAAKGNAEKELSTHTE